MKVWRNRAKNGEPLPLRSPGGGDPISDLRLLLATVQDAVTDLALGRLDGRARQSGA